MRPTAVTARRYFEKAIDWNGEPETITVDKSGANLAALEALNSDRSTPIKVRQSKYLNNVIEQDHRTISRIINADDGFQGFSLASKSCIYDPKRANARRWHRSKFR
jgi:transposase-like protein